MPHSDPVERRAYKRSWYQKNREKHCAGTKKTPEQRRRFKLRQPKEISLARWRLWEALETKLIIRPDRCDWCGQPCVPHGHHPDYSKPLKVEWLCPACHGITRRKDPA